MKTNKYKYFKVLQGDYGNGWEDLMTYPHSGGRTALQQCKHDLLDYRKKEPHIPHRVIRRQECNPLYISA